MFSSICQMQAQHLQMRAANITMAKPNKSTILVSCWCNVKQMAMWVCVCVCLFFVLFSMSKTQCVRFSISDNDIHHSIICFVFYFYFVVVNQQQPFILVQHGNKLILHTNLYWKIQLTRIHTYVWWSFEWFFLQKKTPPQHGMVTIGNHHNETLFFVWCCTSEVHMSYHFGALFRLAFVWRDRKTWQASIKFVMFKLKLFALYGNDLSFLSLGNYIDCNFQLKRFKCHRIFRAHQFWYVQNSTIQLHFKLWQNKHEIDKFYILLAKDPNILRSTK